VSLQARVEQATTQKGKMQKNGKTIKKRKYKTPFNGTFNENVHITSTKLSLLINHTIS